MEIISGFLMSICALFIAIDMIGSLPIFISMTEKLKAKEKRKVLYTSIYMSLGIALLLLITGGIVFFVSGVNAADIQIGGGGLLFIFSIYFLITQQEKKKIPSGELKVLQLALPVIIGPVVFTMLLVLMSSRGLIVTALAFAVNMLLLLIVFKNSKKISDVLGSNGIEIISKITDILLTIFAVMIIRNGFIVLCSSAAVCTKF